MGLKDAREVVVTESVVPSLPVGVDIVEMARAACPDLIARAYELAMRSDRLGDVVRVLEALSDRAYGRPGQSVTVYTSPVQAAWSYIDSDLGGDK